MTWGRGRVVGWGGGGRDQSLSVTRTLTVTVFSHFSVTFSLTFLGFFRSGSEAGLEPGFARVLKISDLFVFRDGAGGGRLHSVFQCPGGGSAIGWRWDLAGGPACQAPAGRRVG